MLQTKKIAFIGAGSMAEAMISGIVSAQKILPKQIVVSNRTNKESFTTTRKSLSD